MNWTTLSDKTIMEEIGKFIKSERLQKNKSQNILAKEAGIACSTLSLFERGKNTSFTTFIQILRSLRFLHLLECFRDRQQFSPLLLAKMEQNMRKRARSTGNKNLTNS